MMKSIIIILYPLLITSLSLSEEPIAILIQATGHTSRCMSDDCDSVYPGSLLFKDDALVTSKDSFTKIRFLENSMDVMVYDKSKLIINGSRKEEGFEESIMVSYGNVFVGSVGSKNTIETPHISLSNYIPSTIYITIDKNNNEKVYMISGEVVLRESGFFDADTLVYGGSLILFNNKSVTFSSSPRRVVKSIINNQILHNVDIPAEILKEYSLISSVGELQPEPGMITIPLRSSSGEFKSLIIEYYINEK